MEDIVVSTSQESVIAISATTNTISITEVEPVVVSTDAGSIITVGTESSVLIERPTSTLLVTGIIGPRGPDGISEEDMVYSKRVDFVTDNELYKAEAVVGTAESSPAWRVRKIIIGNDGDVSETWASGTALFDKVWTARTSYIYS